MSKSKKNFLKKNGSKLICLFINLICQRKKSIFIQIEKFIDF